MREMNQFSLLVAKDILLKYQQKNLLEEEFFAYNIKEVDWLNVFPAHSISRELNRFVELKLINKLLVKKDGSKHLLIDERAIERYLNEYINCWRTDKLQIDEENIISAGNSLLEIVKTLHDLLKTTPTNNILIRNIYPSNLDFIGTLLFLEKNGAIQITKLTSVSRYTISIESNPFMNDAMAKTLSQGIPKVVGIRCNILPKFFGIKFPEINDTNYYKYLTNPEALANKIIFIPPNLLNYGEKHHVLNNGTPYLVINNAYNNNGFIDIESTIKNAKEQSRNNLSENMIKISLKNLKENLQKKFKTQIKEPLFIETFGGLTCNENQLCIFKKATYTQK
jgi:hypothetical protein